MMTGFCTTLGWFLTPAVPPSVGGTPLSQSVPFWVIVGVLALILLALVGYILWRRKHPEAAGKEENPRKPVQEEGQAAAAELSESFKAALSTQQSLVQGSDFRYRMPWFLLLGAKASGKSSLLSESSLAGSVEERAGVEPGTGMAWNFLGTSVAVDIGGWVLASGELHTALWNRVLKLLKNTRPERPLDGLVLAVSAEDLVGEKALPPNQMIERGALIQARLRRLTQVLGFQLPLYLLITKCDALQGFRPFAQEMEPEELSQIFGWSNPYSDRLQFQAEWVDEAVNAMRVTAERVQSRLFAAHEGGPGREAMFLLPGSLYATLAPLRLLLSRALRGGGDAPAPILRGIYCAGATGAQAHPAAQMPELIPVSQPDNGFPRGTALLYEGDQPALRLSPTLAPSVLGSQLGIGFVQDLFLEKIFPERNLAKPLEQFFASRDKVRTRLQIASASLALLLTAGTAISYYRVARDLGRLHGLLGRIDRELYTPAVYTGDPRQRDDRPEARELIYTMANFESGGFRTVFLPASWLSSLPQEVQSTMVRAFQQLVLARLYGGLSHRAQWLSDPSNMPLKAADLSLSAPGPLASTVLEDTPDYRQLQAFWSDVHKLDQNIELYRKICQPDSSGPLQSIVQLDAYLHNGSEDTTPLVTSQKPYFQQAIDAASSRCFDYPPPLDRAITGKAEMLITNLDAAWITYNPVRGVTDRLVDDFKRMSTPGAVDAGDLSRISGDLKQAKAIYDAPELHWVGVAPLAIPANLAAVTTDLADRSPFFEPEMKAKVKSITDGDLSQLLSALSGAETTLTGPVTEAVSDTSRQITLSEGAQEVWTALDALGKTSFVTGAGQSGPASLEVARPAGIVWDKSGLEAAAALPLAYGKFMSDALGQDRGPVRVAVGRIAAAAAAASVQSALLGAEHLSGGSDAFAEAQSFSEAAPSITDLLGRLAQYGLSAPATQLRSVAVHEAVSVLRDLHGTLLKTRPYEVDRSLFTRWNSGLPSAALFGASTPDALGGYLAAQQDELAGLSKAAAPAVHFLEENRSFLPANAAPLLAQWEGIGSAMDGYAAKKPGNSVAALESLISTQLDKTIPPNGCALPDTGRTGRLDYFALAASDLESGLRLRCQYLLTQRFEESYAKLADAFDRNLAERFPFGPLTSLPLAEADPGAIASTYEFYDSAADVFHSPRARAAAPEAQRFLSRLDGARPWFAPLLSNASEGTMTLDLLPLFRAERQREIGGDQIITWALQVGAATAHAGDPPSKLTWKLGDPVVLSLRWAKDSPLLPAPRYPADENAGALKSNGDTVSWKFSDSWALLRFLRTFERDDPAGNAAATVPGGKPFLLELDVPVLPATAGTAGRQPATMTTAKVFLRLLVFAPGAKNTLPRDVFPEVAPPLSVSSPVMVPNQSQGGDVQ